MRPLAIERESVLYLLTNTATANGRRCFLDASIRAALFRFIRDSTTDRYVRQACNKHFCKSRPPTFHGMFSGIRNPTRERRSRENDE